MQLKSRLEPAAQAGTSKPFSSRHLFCPRVTAYHRQSWSVGTHEILFSNKVRNLGFILDSNLTMKQHVIKTCQTTYYELKRISSIRRYPTEDAAEQLVTSCVLSRLDYGQLSSHGHSELCNSTNAESPKYCCTPHSQSSTLSKLHTSPTATPLAPNF